MKRFIGFIFAVIFLFACAVGGFCQVPTQEEAATYFKNNLTNLDPIEGYWHIEIIARGWNNYRRFPDEKLSDNSCVIMKRGTRYNVYPTESYITKVGANQYCYHYVAYRYGNREMSTRNFTLSDIMAFSVSIDLPLPADAVGSGGQHIINSTKVYPTADDYKKIIEEQSKPTEWSGTGFALNNGYIVTNYHVIDEAKSIVVYGVNGNSSISYPAIVIAEDRINDLAIIQIADSRFVGFGNIPYAVKNQMMEVGEDVWVLGYPLTQVLGNEIKLTNGVISSRSGYQGDVATYQISAPVQPGNSGGPLFDSNGNIVGIVNAGVPGAENVGYAIKTSYLKNLVDSYSLSSFLPNNNSISSLALKDQVKRVKNFVFLLICSSKAVPNISSSQSAIHSKSSAPDHIGSSTSTAGNTQSSGSSVVMAKSVSGEDAQVVDLGLSVKWADRNIGASSPDDYGCYFSWGETEPKNDYSAEFYKYFISDCYYSKYSLNKDYGPVDKKARLEFTDDAARVNWGGGWRMPTVNEFNELIKGCTWTWTTQGGIHGYRVTSKKNGNSIFLPATGARFGGSPPYKSDSMGNYWTSSLSTRFPLCPYFLVFYETTKGCSDNISRDAGYTVRPVIE